jgi:hypothetical protein
VRLLQTAPSVTGGENADMGAGSPLNELGVDRENTRGNLHFLSAFRARKEPLFATNTLQRVVMGLLSKPGVTVQAMTSTQKSTSPIVKILKQIPCNVSQAGNMWTFTPHTPEAAQPCVPSQPPDDDPSKSPARAKLRRGLHARADQVGVDREKVTWKVPSGVDGWNPDLVLPV